MGWFFSWYLTITLLGWLTFPLASRLFAALPDRGYTLSRSFGFLLWGYVFWLLTSLGLSQNDVGGLFLGLLVLAGLSVWATQSKNSGGDALSRLSRNFSDLIAWAKQNRRLVMNVEILFFIAFAFLAFVRASNPELGSTEKPMELMFINSILRSPTFPPWDAWLSGYAISYYHFGYVMTAMLAKLTSTPGSAAHNLMTALIFSLAAIGSYGILYNLLSLGRTSGDGNSSSIIRRSFLAPMFLLLISNAEGFLEILYKRRWFWSGDSSAFWKWLDIKDLNQPPAQLSGGLLNRLGFWITSDGVSGIGKFFSEQFEPDRYLWWWRASRVVSDFDLGGGFKEIIDEFPFFSFLHADLHPHVLAIPFGLLTIAAAFNLYLGGWRGEINVGRFRMRINLLGFGLLSLLLGGLAFLNTWDILIAAALVLGVYALKRVEEFGWSWGRLKEVFSFGLPLGISSVLLYLPFYIGFSSQLGGVIPNLVYPTRGAHLWVMFATLLLPLFAYLIYLRLAEKWPGRWWPAIRFSLGLVLLLWGISWFIGWAINWFEPDMGALFLQEQGVFDIRSLFRQASLKRLTHIGGLLTLLAVLIPAIALLVADRKSQTKKAQGKVSSPKSNTFVLLLITMGALLVIGPEFLYLRDQFGTRINTIFKFYYQAWMVWSLAAAYGMAVLIQKLRSWWKYTFWLGFVFLLFVGLTYPVLRLNIWAGGFKIERATTLLDTIFTDESEIAKLAARQELSSLWTMDYFDLLQRQNPDEAAALRWLGNAPDGIISEAIGGSYSGFGRVSTNTGMPTLLGWPGHESQWRGGYEAQGSRKSDVETLYATTDWQLADEIISRYNIRYIFVGRLERDKLLREEKFQQNMRVVFQQGNVVIYEVR